MKPKLKDKIEEKGYTLALSIIAIIVSAIVITTFSKGETNIYKQKETVKYDGVEYSITKVEKKPYELDEDYYVLKITIKINNTSNTTVNYSYYNYSLTNNKDEDITKAAFIYDEDPSLDSGSLEPGESIEGIVFWAVKKGSNNLRVRYYDNILSKTDEFKFQWSINN